MNLIEFIIIIIIIIIIIRLILALTNHNKMSARLLMDSKEKGRK